MKGKIIINNVIMSCYVTYLNNPYIQISVKGFFCNSNGQVIKYIYANNALVFLFAEIQYEMGWERIAVVRKPAKTFNHQIQFCISRDRFGSLTTKSTNLRWIKQYIQCKITSEVSYEVY